MGSAFRKTLIAFSIFALVLFAVLLGVTQRFSQYESLPETMKMVDFSGILLTVLGTAILMLVSIALTLWSARVWAIEQPELGEKIVLLATAVCITLIVVFGSLAGGMVILRTLWTIGYF